MTKQDLKILDKLLDKKFNNLRTELKEVVTHMLTIVNEQKQTSSSHSKNKLLTSLETHTGINEIEKMNNIMESSGNGSKLDFLKNVLNDTNTNQSSEISSDAIDNLLNKLF